MSPLRGRIFTVMIATIMSFIMSGLVTAFNLGFDGFIVNWLQAWIFAWPLAIFSAFIARPIAMRLSGWIERRLQRAEA